MQVELKQQMVHDDISEILFEGNGSSLAKVCDL